MRIAIYELMFRLLCRYFNRYAAFAACAFSAILCTASVYDLFGDYNQTIPFLSVLLLYCVLGFAEAADKKAAGKYLFAAGAMLYVVVEELIPESQSGGEHESADLSTIGFIIGFAIMMILDVALG